MSKSYCKHGRTVPRFDSKCYSCPDQVACIWSSSDGTIFNQKDVFVPSGFRMIQCFPEDRIGKGFFALTYIIETPETFPFEFVNVNLQLALMGAFIHAPHPNPATWNLKQLTPIEYLERLATIVSSKAKVLRLISSCRRKSEINQRMMLGIKEGLFPELDGILANEPPEGLPDDPEDSIRSGIMHIA